MENILENRHFSIFIFAFNLFSSHAKEIANERAGLVPFLPTSNSTLLPLQSY